MHEQYMPIPNTPPNTLQSGSHNHFGSMPDLSLSMTPRLNNLAPYHMLGSPHSLNSWVNTGRVINTMEPN